MKRLIYILSFIFLIAIVMEGCCKLKKPMLKEECGGAIVSDDPNANPDNINDNNSGKDITDSEDDEDQDKDINSD